MRVFMASLLVAFVLLSLVADRGASPQRIATGTVAEVHAGEWMLVRNQGMRLPVAFHASTEYEGIRSAITPGTHVTVWYRFVGERRPVADKVRALSQPVSP